LTVAGVGGVPVDATAVVLNVTATGSTAGSFVTAYPLGTAKPNASNLNFTTGQTVANLVTVRVGDAGQVLFSTAVGATHLVVDVVGYYSIGTGDRFNPIAPSRSLDSRTANGGWDGPIGPGAGNVRTLQVSGRNGVPATATAVVLNVTVADSDTGSFLQVWPTGSSQPNSSNLNFTAGQLAANLVTIKLGSAGQVSFYNAVGHTDVIADVMGYFDPTTGSVFHPLGGPTRILDDRSGIGLSGPWGPDQARALTVTGRNGIPAGATAVVMNTTVASPTVPSYLTIFPSGIPTPTTSNLIFEKSQIVANLTMVSLPPAGTLGIYNQHGTVDVIADAVGYFSSS
jgi:hypothetical protein